MNVRRLFSLVSILLIALSGMAGATPLAAPCAVGAVYDPACDVDHDGDVDIFDIQLTASHWSQYGVYVSDNNHDHLGQTWTGNNNPLKIEGSFAVSPDHFALQGKNSATNSIGVRGEANASGSVGVWGQSDANTGVAGVSVNGAGVWGISTSGPALKATSTNSSGLEVSSAANGMVVLAAGYTGVSVNSASVGVLVNSTTNDGFHVNGAGGDGLHVNSAGFTGVHANTEQANGQWGFYTPDRIFGTVGMFSALSLVAQVSGPDSLAPGDLVAVAGVAETLPGSAAAMPLVRLANGASASVVGVVEHRLALTSRPSRPVATGGEAAPEPEAPELRNADGPARAGDYVAITVLGAAQATVAPGESAIATGTRLTVAADGAVRPLQTRTVDGMLVTEGAPVVGVALEPAKNGLVWVLVNPH
ncbi:hypothetical protein [Candidatus Amarolinea aalborgensis]|uniref:hypothetical protein n=1 Tax=Candidatus Amarolinea aalborgensis TaxID=2249329 RepID=UPI003BF9C1FF